MPDRKEEFADTRTWAASLVARLSQGPDAPPADDLAVLNAQLVAFSTAMTPPPPPDPTVPVVVRDQHGVEELGRALATEAIVALDLETSALDPAAGEIVGIGVAANDATFYIPIAHRLQETGALLPDQLSLGAVVEALGLVGRIFVAHNAKFELRWLRHHTGITPKFAWDTMLAARLLRSDLSADLEEVALRELDVPAWGLSKQEIGRIQLLPIDRVARYCAKDVRYALQLMRRQQQCLV
jgi:DNA polymerase I-like protein with 3'-5' exonuclease and polymerase domains